MDRIYGAQSPLFGIFAISKLFLFLVIKPSEKEVIVGDKDYRRAIEAEESKHDLQRPELPPKIIRFLSIVF